MFKSVLVWCFAVVACSATAFACNGCSIKKAVVKPCPGSEKSNVILLQIDSIVLGSDCVVRPKGWLNATKTVKELRAKWQFQKGLINKNGEDDGCKELEKAARDKDASNYLQLFGFPKKCPIEKKNLRIDNEVDLSKYKDKMSLLSGPFGGKIDLSHGGKARTCFTFDANVECKSL